MIALFLAVLTVATLPPKPEASIDLGTRAGVDLLKAQWQYSDAAVAATEFPGPGADGQPAGPPVKTLTLRTPDA